MTISEFQKTSVHKLESVGISSARLDTLILLEDSLHKDRSWLLANQDTKIPQSKIRRLERKVERRSRHVPLAYIRGHTEFYGRKFKVNRHVLEPRPESETMIELLANLRLPKKAAIADVGTGSGALGITAALELHTPNVDLYDISAGALAVAKHNTHLHELHFHVRKMHLLSRPLRSYDAILANLPYIPDHWTLHPSISMEPKIAFLGGSDGLDLYRKLFSQLHRFSWKPRFVLTECLPPQHDKLVQIADLAGFKLHRHEDFIQVFKPKTKLLGRGVT